MSDLQLDFGPLKTCDCCAHGSDECVCGAWDDHGNLRPYADRIKELEKAIVEWADWQQIKANTFCLPEENLRNIAAKIKDRKEVK